MRTTRSAAQACLLGLGAAVLLALSASPMTAAELANATISGTSLAMGTNQYNLTLNDTGTTKAGTFWFAWIPGDNFMPVSPTSITSPTGWTDTITSGGPSGGFAIQWKASNASSDLAAGASLNGFSFDSSLTLAQLELPSLGNPSDPVATAFVYSGAPFSDAGVQFVAAAAPAAAAAPEPFQLGLMGVGLVAVAGFTRLKRTRSN